MDERVCAGNEDIQTLNSRYTDTSQLRITNMVYKAVYAIAHAIHNAMCQDRNSTVQCDRSTRIRSKQVSQNELANAKYDAQAQSAMFSRQLHGGNCVWGKH